MAKKSAESNTGLIISLVCFVLLSITLGVFAYLGFAGQAELDKKAKEAADKENTMKKSRDQEMLRAAVLRTAIGIPGNNDASTIGSLKRGEETVMNDELKKFNEAFGKYGTAWDSTADTPKLALAGLATSLNDRAERAEQAKKTAEDERDATATQHNQDQQKLTSELKQAQAGLNKANNELQAEKNSKSEAFLSTQKDLTDAQKKNEQTLQASDAMETDLRRKIKSLDEQIAQLKLVKEKLEGERRGLDLLAYDQPKGNIVRIDRSTGLVYIDKGSADYVRPQLAFSVMPTEAVGKGAMDLRRKKASLEVVNILGAHLSTAKVTELTNTRDPIVTGDLLFNPAWSPNSREHVAVIGLIDLDGNGQDDTLQFVRNLERWGVVVDLYLDMKDLSVHGNGMTYQTSYLVVGERPEKSGGGDRPGDKLLERKDEIRKRIDELETQAKGMGIQVVSARKFLAMIGFPLPKTSLQPNFATAGVVRREASTPAPAGTPAEPKEEKKQP